MARNKTDKLAFLEKGVSGLTEEVNRIKESVEKQEKMVSSIVTGVLIASFLIVLVIAVEVILFHSNDKVSYNKYSHDTKKSEIIKLDDPIK